MAGGAARYQRRRGEQGGEKPRDPARAGLTDSGMFWSGVDRPRGPGAPVAR
jgi:hypothetical protein